MFPDIGATFRQAIVNHDFIAGCEDAVPDSFNFENDDGVWSIPQAREPAR